MLWGVFPQGVLHVLLIACGGERVDRLDAESVGGDGDSDLDVAWSFTGQSEKTEVEVVKVGFFFQMGL